MVLKLTARSESFRVLKITARLNSFRTIKLSNLVIKLFEFNEKQSEQLEKHLKRVIIKLARLESFRALIISNLESSSALNLSY